MICFLLLGALAKPSVEVESLGLLTSAAQSIPPPGEVYISAVMTLNGVSLGELRQLELYDRKWSEPAGNPQYICLDGEDVVRCEGGEMRVRAVWSVPETATRAAIYVKGRKRSRRYRLIPRG